MIEVLILLVFVVMLFGAGVNNPLGALGDAMRARLSIYTESVSRP
jgi:hypothetical protein